MAPETDIAVRVPQAVIREIALLAGGDRGQIDQFVLGAVADKLAELRDRAEFARRAARGDVARFKHILANAGAAPPRPDDHVPTGWLGLPG